jgi:hypothetical protein
VPIVVAPAADPAALAPYRVRRRVDANVIVAIWTQVIEFPVTVGAEGNPEACSEQTSRTIKPADGGVHEGVTNDVPDVLLFTSGVVDAPRLENVRNVDPPTVPIAAQVVADVAMYCAFVSIVSAVSPSLRPDVGNSSVVSQM